MTDNEPKRVLNGMIRGFWRILWYCKSAAKSAHFGAGGGFPHGPFVTYYRFSEGAGQPASRPG
jgi:hypothetical protein